MKSLSIVINVESNKNSKLEKSLESILDYTKPTDIANIILLTDENVSYDLDYLGLPISYARREQNLPASFNVIANNLNSSHVAFICDDVKILDNDSGCNWWEHSDDEDCYSIPEYDLDAYLWQSRGKLISGVEFENFGLRKFGSDTKKSATCTNNVLICKVDYFKKLGGYNENYEYDFYTEFCLRSCLEKKTNYHPFNGGRIASRQLDTSIDKSRLCYEYFRNYYKYHTLIEGDTWKPSRGINSSIYNIDQFVDLHFDRRLFNLANSAAGKKVAVVGFGASVDDISEHWLHDYDILIGVDYMGSVFNCDYCVTERLEVVSTVVNSGFDLVNMILPYKLEDKTLGKLISNPYDKSIRYAKSDRLISKYPPFIDGCAESIALHVAIFMNPASIALFGYDFRIIDDLSHTSKTQYYNNGKIWKNTEASKNILRQREREIEALVRLAEENKIKVMRVTYA